MPVSPVISGLGQVQVGLGAVYSSFASPPNNTHLFEFAKRWLSALSLTMYGSFKTGIALTGTKNGSNKVFTIPDTIKLNSEIIYWNGGRQIRGDDYTISGSTVTFSAGHPAPLSGDTLVSDYLV